MSETESKNCMLDLETLGNGNKAVIVSIGACMFLPSGNGAVGTPFEAFVDPQSCIDAGLVMDPSTVLWWMDPKQAQAREVLMGKMGKAIPLRAALARFAEWFGDSKPTWGCGATFDNVIMRNAYAAVGLKCPWAFWDDRCYRTMKNLVPSVKMQREGIHHSAYWDALSQAKHLQQIIRHLTQE